LTTSFTPRSFHPPPTPSGDFSICTREMSPTDSPRRVSSSIGTLYVSRSPRSKSLYRRLSRLNRSVGESRRNTSSSVPDHRDELVRTSTVSSRTGSLNVVPLGIALMNSNGSYGFGKLKLSRPLISPDCSVCPRSARG
jgi:hypothetical protein